MKKKLLVTALIATMVLSMTACGGSETTEPSDVAVNNSETQSVAGNEAEKETPTEAPNETTEEVKNELPNWVGVYDGIGHTVVNSENPEVQGTYNINIAYPSMKPSGNGCAYQKDPSLVLVTTTGKTSDMQSISVTNVEETFEISKEWIIKKVDSFRDAKYSDFDFVVEEQELMTINDLSTCKYTGKHTYVYDGTAQEIPFVAYSFYTGQIENYSYFTVIVMDDSINNPSMEPLAEGTIEAYARKMVESVELK